MGSPPHSFGWLGRGGNLRGPGCDGDGAPQLGETWRRSASFGRRMLRTGVRALLARLCPLTTRSPSIRRQASTTIPLLHLPRVGGQEVCPLDIKSFERRGNFFVAKEGSVAAGACDDGSLFAWRVPRLLHRENRPVQLLVVVDGRHDRTVGQANDIFAQGTNNGGSRVVKQAFRILSSWY
ncbi:hypothetical protein GWK47_054961 [Chionoecetes opilio]|uniref:Uncharacterized protein n=1 Tax=Chionoecetes opilio TaxID=41210 RepID=A0A8J4XYK9_CHIOP|nr:hypothetical protein GWK47_054961 [Chionoecetes opilio]